jgi:hypothetical protein
MVSGATTIQPTALATKTALINGQAYAVIPGKTMIKP